MVKCIRFTLFHGENEKFNIRTRKSIMKQRDPVRKLVVVALSFFLVRSVRRRQGRHAGKVMSF